MMGGKVVALCRALAVGVSMGLMLGVYLLTRIVLPHTDKSSFRLRRRWINWVGLRALGIRVESTGTPALEPAIYVCNHRSFSDPLVNCKYIDAFIIAKAEIANYPIINKGAETTGIIWVDRASRDSRIATRQAMVDTVIQGRNILIYPEGTVSDFKTTRPYKRGPFKTAAEYGLPVVPVAIEYRDSKDLWVKGSLLTQYFRQFGVWRTEVKMAIGPTLKSSDADDLYNDAVSWTSGQLISMQQGWSKAQYTTGADS